MNRPMVVKSEGVRYPEAMTAKIVAALLAATLPIACADDQDPSRDLEVSTSGEGSSTGEDGSSSSGSTGDGSSSSTGQPFMGEPDPRPTPGSMWGACQRNTDCEGYGDYCLVPEGGWEAWGVCTKECTAVEECSNPFTPKSAAILTCDQTTPISNLFCLMVCEDSSECPQDMRCTLLPEDDSGKKICA